MKTILAVILTCLLSTLAYATLTNTTIPVTKNGASNPPTLQNGSITDTGTSAGAGNVGIGSTNPGVALDVVGTARSSYIISSGNLSIGSTKPTNLLEIRETNAFTKVYNFNGVSTYTDDTTEAKKTYGTAFSFLASSSQTLYLGSTSKFSGTSISVKLPTTADDALIITYWNGAAWASLTNVDNTNNFQNSGTITFTPPNDWATTSVNSQTLYWIAIQSTTTFGTTPSLYSIRPGIDSVLAAFCSLSDTNKCLFINQDGNILASNTTGTNVSVSTPTTIVVGLPTSRQGRRVDYMCSGTKDQVCINNAIATGCPSGACKIILLEGTYNTTGNIIWDHDFLTMEGMGIGKTIIKPSSAVSYVIQEDASTNASPRLAPHISNLEIDGTNMLHDGSIGRKGISLPNSKHVFIDHVYVHDTGATGVAIDFAQGVIITNSIIENCGTSGTTTGNSGIGNGSSYQTTEPEVIADNIITGSGYANILLESQNAGTQSNDYIVTGNILNSSNGPGVVLRGTSSVIVSNNIIRLNTGDGVFVDNYNGEESNNIKIENNNISGGSAFGIRFSNAAGTNLSVKNNDLSNNASGTISNGLSDKTQLSRWNNTGDTVNYIVPNIGIGSSNPNFELDVVGTVRATNFTGNFINNVGIGSTNPGTRLDVTGTVRAAVFVGNGAQLSGVSAGAAGSTNAVQYNSGSSTMGGAESVFSFNGTNVGIGTNSGVNLVDIRGTIATRAFQVTAAGNVGIGSVTPGTAVDVNGTVRASAFVGDGSGLTGLASNQWATQNTTDVSLANGNVGIGTTITSNAALVVMNGNIGIGTWKPTVMLQVGSGTSGFQVSSAGSITAITNTTSASLTSTVLTLASSGGTASIKNGGSTSNSALSVIGSAATNGFLELRATSGIGTGAEYVKITAGNNGGTEIARMFGNGNVGIGSITPSATLDVEGTVVFNALAGKGNVGIGSFSPGQKLDVQGTVRFSNAAILMTGPSPTLASCGTSPSITGNDNWFRVTVGATTGTCNVTFANPKANLLGCVCFDETENVVNAFSFTPSSSGVNTSQTSEGGSIFDCSCGFN